jgi:hypothetical protein
MYKNQEIVGGVLSMRRECGGVVWLGAEGAGGVEEGFFATRVIRTTAIRNKGTQPQP